MVRIDPAALHAVVRLSIGAEPNRWMEKLVVVIAGGP
jgi:hypothetical protein